MVFNTFSGTFDIIHLGTFLYEGWERNWNIVGKSEEENAKFNLEHGRLFEVKLHSPILGRSEDGKPRWVCGAGKSLEKALDSARFHAISLYTIELLKAFGWKKE